MLKMSKFLFLYAATHYQRWTTSTILNLFYSCLRSHLMGSKPRNWCMRSRESPHTSSMTFMLNWKRKKGEHCWYSYGHDLKIHLNLCAYERAKSILWGVEIWQKLLKKVRCKFLFRHVYVQRLHRELSFSPEIKLWEMPQHTQNDDPQFACKFMEAHSVQQKKSPLVREKIKRQINVVIEICHFWCVACGTNYTYYYTTVHIIDNEGSRIQSFRKTRPTTTQWKTGTGMRLLTICISC